MGQAGAAIDIGGLDVPLGPTFQVGQIYQNITTSEGATLAGYGKVDSINSIPVTSLATDGELTYVFDDYVVTSLSPTQIKFAGGEFRFYLGFGADNDFDTNNAGGSAGDLIEATNGTLFLTLTGHAIDGVGNTFVGTGAGIGTTSPTGFGSGLLDVDTAAGGIANTFFDSNGISAVLGGNADLQIGSSFSALNPVYPGEGFTGAAAVRGSADLAGTVVPEPASCSLMLAGVGAMTFTARRRGA